MHRSVYNTNNSTFAISFLLIFWANKNNMIGMIMANAIVSIPLTIDMKAVALITTDSIQTTARIAMDIPIHSKRDLEKVIISDSYHFHLLTYLQVRSLAILG